MSVCSARSMLHWAWTQCPSPRRAIDHGRLVELSWIKWYPSIDIHITSRAACNPVACLRLIFLIIFIVGVKFIYHIESCLLLHWSKFFWVFEGSGVPWVFCWCLTTGESLTRSHRLQHISVYRSKCFWNSLFIVSGGVEENSSISHVASKPYLAVPISGVQSGVSISWMSILLSLKREMTLQTILFWFFVDSHQQ